MVGRVYPARPVPDLDFLRVATQADAIRVGLGSLPGRNDFACVSPTRHVKAARTVAFLATDTLLGLIGMLKILGAVCVAGCARFGAHRRGLRNLRVFPEGC
jgi:hypothetical protein